MRGCVGYVLLMIGVFFLLCGAVVMWGACHGEGDTQLGITALVMGAVASIIGTWLRGD